MANDSHFITSKNAKARIGVHAHTKSCIREWANSGLLPSIRVPSGQRLYDVDAFIRSHIKEVTFPQTRGTTESDSVTVYKILCPVTANATPSRGHKSSSCGRNIPIARSSKMPVLVSTGRGNSLRPFWNSRCAEESKKLWFLLRLDRDRLCRFAFELVEWILANGCRLVVLAQGMAASKLQHGELADVLLAIV